VAEAVLLSLVAVRVTDLAGVCAGVMEVMAVLSPAVVRRDLLRAAGQAALWPAAGAGWPHPSSSRRWRS
jgi:hypothetical protein